ncbi:MBL fold metallo-hydrolase [Amycolatopsis endophytica]|uniref:L-ascorbate metabolism protein UlaG (Beta-lactamase superfamily) n=1 Tax=Amycolatopsis endophytica TaxID=860233 RepID=A0A853BAX9_9PSEU|nr:MBL fold metallo-hydrolase [Amycolatopsis endophytica]NYI91935.1 L-ascorbate metabolism protein UlaG (beta-lactamase superfamily) [Amycolatopsis endophytica]
MFPADSLTFIGTATTLVRLGPFTLLTDPNFLHRGQWSYFGQGLVSRRRTEPAAQVADLPPLDGVVLSHLHGDHFDRVARRDLPADVPILTTGHAATRLSKHGFRSTVALDTWHSETFTDGAAKLTVTAVPARHSRGPLNRILPPVMGSIWEFSAHPGAATLRIYVSGDTIMHDELAEIRRRYPEIDLAVLHLGGTRVLGVLVTMDDRQGGRMLDLIRPGHVVPVHFDDYGKFTSPVSNFLHEARHHPATDVRLLARGDSLALGPMLSPG